MRAVPAFCLSGLLFVGGCLTELPTPNDPCARWEEPGLFLVKLPQDDTKKRKAWVYVPDSEGPRPMVVALHGAGQNHTRMSDLTRFIRLSQQEGFVAVFPDGLGFWISGWNAGGCCAAPREDAKDVDDVAYLDELSAEISDRTCGAEVMAAGFSAGGMMAHRWGCEGKNIDGIMPTSGPLMVPQCDGPPLPMRHYHGLADTVVPSKGGFGENALVDYPSVDQTMAKWRERNNCTDAEPTIEVDGDVTCTKWTCEAATEMCLVDDWAHRYPGGANRVAGQHDATVAGWAWFKQTQDLP